MSLPTVPYTNQQEPIVWDEFGKYALMPRFRAYTCGERGNCSYTPPPIKNPSLVESPPCCPAMAGIDVLGIGSNDKVLQYQFGSSMDVPFCGLSMNNQCGLMDGVYVPTNCKACPCQQPGCQNFGSVPGCCNYGFGRQPNQVFGPYGGNRYGNIKWG
jgi:hypothetical protein